MAPVTGILLWLAFLIYSCHGQPSQNADCLEDRTLDKLCVNPKYTSEIGCMGRGDCVCGVCACHVRLHLSQERYSGQYCQCDDYSCFHHDDKLCGGHGRCVCDKCVCDSGYTGDACECPLSQDTCKAENGVICNGNGVCECGVCKCDSSHRGPTCEDCPSCPGDCEKDKACVLCEFGSGPHDAQTCDEKCSTQNMVIVSQIDTTTQNDVYHCRVHDEEDNCHVRFTREYGSYAYKTASGAIRYKKIHVLDSKECSGAAAVFSSSTLSLLLGALGLLVLIQTNE